MHTGAFFRDRVQPVPGAVTASFRRHAVCVPARARLGKQFYRSDGVVLIRIPLSCQVTVYSGIFVELVLPVHFIRDE